jgi:transcriptional regulator with XRE-family HTH domain
MLGTTIDVPENWASNAQMSHAHYIREWRKFRGVSQSELAEKIEMGAGHLSRIERGTVAYTQQVLEKVGAALKCTPADLLSRDPAAAEDIWAIYEAMQPVQRVQLVEIAKMLGGKS